MDKFPIVSIFFSGENDFQDDQRNLFGGNTDFFAGVPLPRLTASGGVW